MSTAEAILFGLALALFVAAGIIGCASTKRPPREMVIEQHYINEAHKRQLDEWRRDGRLPPE